MTLLVITRTLCYMNEKEINDQSGAASDYLIYENSQIIRPSPDDGWIFVTSMEVDFATLLSGYVQNYRLVVLENLNLNAMLWAPPLDGDTWRSCSRSTHSKDGGDTEVVVVSQVSSDKTQLIVRHSLLVLSLLMAPNYPYIVISLSTPSLSVVTSLSTPPSVQHHRQKVVPTLLCLKLFHSGRPSPSWTKMNSMQT